MDFLYIGFWLFAFALQLAACLLFKRVILRLLPLALAVIANGILFVMIFTSEGWDVIGSLMLFAVGLGVLGACVLAWGVFGVIALIRFSRKGKADPTPSEME